MINSYRIRLTSYCLHDMEGGLNANCAEIWCSERMLKCHQCEYYQQCLSCVFGAVQLMFAFCTIWLDMNELKINWIFVSLGRIHKQVSQWH